jgi:Integrase core domain
VEILSKDRIRDRPISPRSPWQNAYVERLIGTLRRDCLDHVLIFGERHLRRVLTLYSLYYNETRTHLALGKDAPVRRAVLHHATRGYDFREGQVSPVLKRLGSKVDTTGLAKLTAIEIDDCKVMRAAYGRCSSLLHSLPDALNKPLPAPDRIQAEIDALPFAAPDAVGILP